MKLFAAAIVVLGISWWLTRQSACRHVDDDGQSTLQWAARHGRLCGYCHQCQRFTRGWEIPARPLRPQRRARIATLDEVARARAQRQARWRTVRRMRGAA